jgi:hypothetical protein
MHRESCEHHGRQRRRSGKKGLPQSIIRAPLVAPKKFVRVLGSPGATPSLTAQSQSGNMRDHADRFRIAAFGSGWVALADHTASSPWLIPVKKVRNQGP